MKDDPDYSGTKSALGHGLFLHPDALGWKPLLAGL